MTSIATCRFWLVWNNPTSNLPHEPEPLNATKDRDCLATILADQRAD